MGYAYYKRRNSSLALVVLLIALSLMSDHRIHVVARHLIETNLSDDIPEVPEPEGPDDPEDPDDPVDENPVPPAPVDQNPLLPEPDLPEVPGDMPDLPPTPELPQLTFANQP